MTRKFSLPALTAVATVCTAMTATNALAHEGHGLPGLSHWHGTDVLGFVLMGLAVGYIWMKGRK